MRCDLHWTSFLRQLNHCVPDWPRNHVQLRSAQCSFHAVGVGCKSFAFDALSQKKYFETPFISFVEISSEFSLFPSLHPRQNNYIAPQMLTH
jgi:hypothetical protein